MRAHFLSNSFVLYDLATVFLLYFDDLSKYKPEPDNPNICSPAHTSIMHTYTHTTHI